MSWTANMYDREWPFDLTASEFALNRRSTALVLVDLQQGDIKLGADSEMAVKYPKIAEYWNGRLEEIVIPNTTRLISHFRQNQMKVIYTRTGNMTPGYAELTERLRKRMPKDAGTRHRGTAKYEIDPRLLPLEDELVIDKLTSGAFTQTFLDHALRNMGITDIVVIGILTDMCILGTARTAAELGYNTLICEDACASYTERAHVEALLMHARVFGRVSDTDEVLEELRNS